MTMFSDDDARFMKRAVSLARRGLGRTEPNPMVGAVVVKDGKIIGEGFHERFGGNHAEVWALLAAGKQARGATIYVTLEPCCHWGKTPPCTEAILHTGISRVVAAMTDPFAKVRGKGIRLLRAKGVRVDVGLLEEEAREVNKAFITRQAEGRPFVIAKWAQSLDGCVATARGESKWISSEVSRGFVQKLRGRMDGIVVGIGTALADDPMLTARPARKGDVLRVATRIVMDSQCRLPVGSKLVGSVAEAPVMVAHGRRLKGVAARRAEKLAGRGVMTVGVAGVGELLKHLGTLEYANVLVEGGPTLMGAFFRDGLVDEAHVFVAPMVIGGKNARHAVGGADLKRLADAYRMRVAEVKMSGPDVHLILLRNF
jgi:diaminohydroxyphosphoribosylaminopyrimidine deaminase/5-amino-6-(5-phosphoribosylamino)uracil reductase